MSATAKATGLKQKTCTRRAEDFENVLFDLMLYQTASRAYVINEENVVVAASAGFEEAAFGPQTFISEFCVGF